MSASTPKNPPRPVPASGIRHRNISTGCSNLDAILRGGAKTKLVTELVGENGSGKTQVCLQLLLETVGGGSFGRRRPQNRHHHHRRDGDDEDGEEGRRIFGIFFSKHYSEECQGKTNMIIIMGTTLQPTIEPFSFVHTIKEKRKD